MNIAPAGHELSDRQRLNWLRLIRTENIGPATFRDLINRFGSAEAAIEMLPSLVRQGGGKRLLKVPPIAQVEAELEAAERTGARFVALGEPDYPAILRRSDSPPPLLAIKGNARVFARPAVAIVGARNASLAGIRMARLLARQLGEEGYAVVSGLARGIDAAAHEGSLSTGTVAVLAGGIDRPYPPENFGLLARLSEEGGAVVSEMPFGWEPRAKDFPRRNRIVAGLAHGLVVVEAAMRSGSLISARMAGELGRIVFAVPGSPLDPRAAGANGLLKDGAILVTEVADITNALATQIGMRAPMPPQLETPPAEPILPPDETDRDRVMEALGPTPVSLDEIIRHTGLHASQVALILVELDLAGRLERHAGGNVSMV